MKKITKKNRLYWALIFTFAALYLAVAFVSTLHAITFFQLANTLGLAILLGAAYEIGQASVLFSILMTENKNRMLAWLMMFLLTALQVTANVYASFKFMDESGITNWTFWQRSILFWLEGGTAETYKVIISWISGALLPLVALGMTALVAENLKLKDQEDEEIEEIEEIKEEFKNNDYPVTSEVYTTPDLSINELKKPEENKGFKPPDLSSPFQLTLDTFPKKDPVIKLPDKKEPDSSKKALGWLRKRSLWPPNLKLLRK